MDFHRNRNFRDKETDGHSLSSDDEVLKAIQSNKDFVLAPSITKLYVRAHGVSTFRGERHSA